SNGAFVFLAANGSYNLSVRKPGYLTESILLTIRGAPIVEDLNVSAPAASVPPNAPSGTIPIRAPTASGALLEDAAIGAGAVALGLVASIGWRRRRHTPAPRPPVRASPPGQGRRPRSRVRSRGRAVVWPPQKIRSAGSPAPRTRRRV
ncbi:MAG: hypothetical protein ACREC5_06705, partial [Thermoplasmata archaeon]